MENYLLLIVGILLSVLGAVNIKGNIRTIHAYNRRNVREEDIPKYGRAVGTGSPRRFLFPCGMRLPFRSSFFRGSPSVWHSFCTDRSSTITGFFDSFHWKRKRTVFPSSFALFALGK